MQDQKPTALQSAPTTAIQPTDARPLALPARSQATDAIVDATPPEPLPHIGIRGYLRLGRVLTSVFLFGLRVIINTRGWRIGKKTLESELRRREGELLREKLLKLGPTFIKIGQTLATRADLLPVEYIQELAKLQDEVPPFPTEQARAI